MPPARANWPNRRVSPVPVRNPSRASRPSTRPSPNGVPPVPVPPGGTEAPVPPGSPIKGPERLYQGRTESDWQALFTAETEPGAKLDAAMALINLAAQLPADQRIERILDVGE